MPRFAALLPLCLALACASPLGAPSAQRRAPVRTSFREYEVPPMLGEFDLAKRSDIAQAEAGFGANYASSDPALRLDFFVFSALNMPPDVSVADVLWAQYEQTKREVEYAANQNRWKLALASESALRLASKLGEIDGALATYQGTLENGERVTTRAFLALLGTDFVKMRATRAGEPSAETDAAIEAALREFVAELTLVATRPPRGYSIQIGIDARGVPSACVFAAKIAAGAVLEELLQRGMTLHTLERQVALLERAAGFVARGDAPCEDRALLDIAATQRAGFLREYAWTFARASYWRDPGDLRLAEFETFRKRELGRRGGLAHLGVGLQFAEPMPAASEEN
jgi:hypothetical protein